MNTQNYQNTVGEDYLLSTILNQDAQNSEQSILDIDHRIAERKKLEYKNIIELERARQKVEECLNSISWLCSEYNPNPKSLAVKSKLETEMVRIELKKGEEAVNCFRDVERLEAEKRKLLEDLRDEKAMTNITGGLP